MTPIELEQLAVMFRVNDPNLGHVSTLETLTEVGLAYSYGLEARQDKLTKAFEVIMAEVNR